MGHKVQKCFVFLTPPPTPTSFQSAAISVVVVTSKGEDPAVLPSGILVSSWDHAGKLLRFHHKDKRTETHHQIA